MKGFDALIRQMKELEEAAASLDGDIGEVSFDPHNPQSIDLAIQTMEAAIDERIGTYHSNELVQGIVQELKETGRKTILERAAAARQGEGDEK